MSPKGTPNNTASPVQAPSIVNSSTASSSKPVTGSLKTSIGTPKTTKTNTLKATTGIPNPGTGTPKPTSSTLKDVTSTLSSLQDVCWDLENFSLRWRSKDDKEGEYDKGSDAFRLVADAYYIGFQIFQRTNARKELQYLGERCALDWTDPLMGTKYGNFKWEGDKSMIDKYLQNFIDGVKKTSPVIYNDGKMKPHIYGTTQRSRIYSANYETLHTRELFRILINPMVIGNLKEAFKKQDNSRYQEFRIILATTFFHELTHAFVFFLMGTLTNHQERRPHTPPECSQIRKNPQLINRLEDIGESGFFLETTILGGELMLRKFLLNNTERYGVCAMDKDRRSRVLSIETIKGFLQNPKSYDIKSDIQRSGFLIVSSEPPAKRQKLSASGDMTTRDRQDGWSIKFNYGKTHNPIIIETQPAVVN